MRLTLRFKMKNIQALRNEGLMPDALREFFAVAGRAKVPFTVPGYGGIHPGNEIKAFALN